LARDNLRLISKSQYSNFQKSAFFMRNDPPVNFLDYLKRIYKYLNPEISTLIIAMIYIDRVCSIKSNNVVVIEENIFKLFSISILIAIKFSEDKYQNNKYFAKVIGISLEELNFLEKEFLNLIDFKLYISDNFFKKYYNYLMNY